MLTWKRSYSKLRRHIMFFTHLVVLSLIPYMECDLGVIEAD